MRAWSLFPGLGPPGLTSLSTACTPAPLWLSPGLPPGSPKLPCSDRVRVGDSGTPGEPQTPVESQPNPETHTVWLLWPKSHSDESPQPPSRGPDGHFSGEAPPVKGARQNTGRHCAPRGHRQTRLVQERRPGGEWGANVPIRPLRKKDHGASEQRVKVRPGCVSQDQGHS